MRSMEGTHLARHCQVFNGHQIAAAHLVQAHLLDHFRRTKHTDIVVLAGFGRFGQTVLDELQRAAAGCFDRVVIVDLEGTSRGRIFEEQVGYAPGYTREIVDGDIRDPTVWHRVEERVELAGIEPVFVVGSGIDRTNLRISMRLAARYPTAFIIARSERKWAFAEAVSRDAGIKTFSVAELVAESMPRPWFGPRTHAPSPMPEPSRPSSAAAE
jgi:voltage-gated potassium channel Kch